MAIQPTTTGAEGRGVTPVLMYHTILDFISEFCCKVTSFTMKKRRIGDFILKINKNNAKIENRTCKCEIKMQIDALN